MPVNKNYFIDLMKDRNLSMREVARRLDAWPAGLSRAFDGKRKFTLGETAGLARVLGVPLAEVMVNAGIDNAVQAGRRCNIIGHIKDFGIVEPIESGTIERVAIPDMLDDDVVALQAHTANTAWHYCDGWLTFLSSPREPSDLINMLAMCELEDGEKIVAVIRRGYNTGLFNLYNAGGNIRTNIRISTARKALLTLY